MSLFSRIKNRKMTVSKISRSKVTKLRQTSRLSEKSIPIFLVFDFISDDVNVYYDPNVTPLYAAITSEEAIAACIQMTYVKQVDHYIAWCAYQGYTPGMNQDSWWTYMETCLGGVNAIIATKFKILMINFSLREFISMYRVVLGTTAVLDLPTATPTEFLTFMDRAKINYSTSTNSVKTPTVVPIDQYDKSTPLSTKQLYSVLNCNDVGEYLGKLFLVNPSDFLYSDGGYTKSPGSVAVSFNKPTLVDRLTDAIETFDSEDPNSSASDPDSISKDQPNPTTIVLDRAVNVANNFAQFFIQKTQEVTLDDYLFPQKNKKN